MVLPSFSDANILNIFSGGSLLPGHTVPSILGRFEAYAPGAGQQRRRHGHRPHRVLPQRRVRHFSKNFRGLKM